MQGWLILGTTFSVFFMVHDDDENELRLATLRNVSYDENYFFVDMITARCLKSGVIGEGWPENIISFLRPNEEPIANAENNIGFFIPEDNAEEFMDDEEILISDDEFEELVNLSSSSSSSPMLQDE